MDKKAAWKIVLKNEKLIHWYLGKFRGYFSSSDDYDDIFQNARIKCFEQTIKGEEEGDDKTQTWGKVIFYSIMHFNTYENTLVKRNHNAVTARKKIERGERLKDKNTEKLAQADKCFSISLTSDGELGEQAGGGGGETLLLIEQQIDFRAAIKKISDADRTFLASHITSKYPGKESNLPKSTYNFRLNKARRALLKELC